MIEVNNLTKEFPGVVAVQDISFSVRKGEILGFLGPNGAGKTTTMRIVTCSTSPTRGNVTVGGHDVVRDSLRVRRLVGYLPENNPLYTEMRVEEYLRFRSKLKLVPSSERKGAVGEAIDRCGLQNVRGKIIGHLSKGYRQRVGLADAIVHKPEIVILDEPTIGLDPNQIRQVRQLIKELGEQRTVILSTHILPEVEIMCKRIIIISRGKIAAQGTMEEIADTMKLSAKVRLEIAGDGEEIKKGLDGLPCVQRVFWTAGKDIHRFSVEAKENRDIRSDLYDACVKNNWALKELAYERASLEDAFVKLTQKVE